MVGLMAASVNRLARAYVGAEAMRAIAMTDFPKIGHVAEQLEMVTTPVLERPKTESDVPRCIVCGTPTDQSCGWCDRPLHRHLGQDGQGKIIRSQCYLTHLRECDSSR